MVQDCIHLRQSCWTLFLVFLSLSHSYLLCPAHHDALISLFTIIFIFSSFFIYILHLTSWCILGHTFLHVEDQGRRRHSAKSCFWIKIDAQSEKIFEPKWVPHAGIIKIVISLRVRLKVRRRNQPYDFCIRCQRSWIHSTVADGDRPSIHCNAFHISHICLSISIRTYVHFINNFCGEIEAAERGKEFQSKNSEEDQIQKTS